MTLFEAKPYDPARRPWALLFSFDGRISRSQFWAYSFPYLLIYVVLYVVGILSQNLVLAYIYAVVMLYPTLAVNVNRCHDRGRSGWFVLLVFLPLVNVWYLVEVGFLRGTDGTNEFGPDPVRQPVSRTPMIAIQVAAIAVIVLGFGAWNFRHYPEERLVDHFFAALQQQNYEQAYGIWNHDPEWKQHPQKYSGYSFQNFMIDWGPGGEWGIIKSYHVDGSAVPKGGNGTKFDVGSSGVVVVVTVNERVAQKAHIWVEKSDKTLGFSPF